MEINFNITKRSNEHIMKKFKVLSLILALILVFSMFPMSVMASETDTQTESAEQTTDAMAITTVDQFKALNGQSGTYYLASDINFEGASFDTAIVESFNGVLDGRGKTIYGFELNATDAENVGVFGTLGTDAVVSNFTVGTATAPIKATVSASNALNFGFLAGKAEGTALVADITVYSAEQSTVTAAGTLAVGGILGCGVATDLSECVFNGTLTVNGGTTGGIGGIVGMLGNAEDAKVNSLLTKCVNNATITAATEVKVAGIVGSAASTVQIMECVNNGSATVGILGENTTTSLNALTVIYNCSTASGKIYGVDKEDGSYGKRIYIAGCTGNENTPAYEEGKYQNYYDYVVLITAADDFANIGTGDYNAAGFYRLANSIDFTVQYTGGAVATFSGVLDGAGENFNNLDVMYDSSDYVSFFKVFAEKGDAAVINMQILTKKVYLASNRYASALIGVAKGTYNSAIYNVDVYSVTTSKSAGNAQRIGGLIGVADAGSTKIVDSNAYGSLESYQTQNVAVGGGFIGACKVDTQILILNSNNYSNVNMKTDKSVNNSKRSVSSGFIGGDANCDAVLYNCANFGEIKHTWPKGEDPDTPYAVHVGAFAGYVRNLTLVGCSNFGNISGNSCGSAAGTVIGAASLVNFNDFGTVTTDKAGSSRYVHTANENTAVKYCNANSYDAVVSMIKGAAIRIDDVKGIRFKSTVSTDAIAALEDIFGEGTVSYGTIITPSAFIHNENGAGEFTMEALDAFGNRLGTLGGDKAYVKIDSTNQWFNNENGHIAGSIVGIDSLLYQVKFSARAYVSVTVNGTPIYTLYSDYSEEINSRSVEYVANKAIADFKYQKNTDTTKWYNDAACTEEYTKDDKTTYKNVVSEANGVIKYSCYTADQLAAINTILDTIPDTPATAG